MAHAEDAKGVLFEVSAWLRNSPLEPHECGLEQYKNAHAVGHALVSSVVHWRIEPYGAAVEGSALASVLSADFQP